jgi:hypothetical protein
MGIAPLTKVCALVYGFAMRHLIVTITLITVFFPSFGWAQDADGDGALDVEEDWNGDGDLTNDDTDFDGSPNYLDIDDDNDGILTLDEDLNGSGSPMDDDSDGDGVPNFYDEDDDGDTLLTRLEDANGDGDPLNDDTDFDGVLNYLDLDSDGGGTSDQDEAAAGTDPLDPSDDAGLPLNLELVQPIVPTPNALNRWTFTGAAPNAIVNLHRSARIGPKPVGGCPGLYLQIEGATFVASGTADAYGSGFVDFFIPAGAVGQVRLFQAADNVGCQISDLQLVFF